MALRPCDPRISILLQEYLLAQSSTIAEADDVLAEAPDVFNAAFATSDTFPCSGARCVSDTRAFRARNHLIGARYRVGATIQPLQSRLLLGCTGGDCLKSWAFLTNRVQFKYAVI
jgi:hypothetical protein